MSDALGLRRLQHLVLWIGNVDRSVRFYCDVLGFEVQRRYPNAAFLTIPGSGDDHNLGLFEQPGLRPPDEGVARMYHAAWEVAELPDLARARQRLIEAHSLVGQSDHGTSLSLYAKDPDGLEFEVSWLVPHDLIGDDVDVSTLPLDLDAEIERYGADRVGALSRVPGTARA
jgi:catechol-2,3-dioxygenase